MAVCPACGAESAYKTMCATCGASFAEDDLPRVDVVAPGVNAPAENKPSRGWKVFSAIVGFVVGTFVWFYIGVPVVFGWFDFGRSTWFDFVGFLVVLVAWPVICGVIYGLLYLSYDG